MEIKIELEITKTKTVVTKEVVVISWEGNSVNTPAMQEASAKLMRDGFVSQNCRFHQYEGKCEITNLSGVPEQYREYVREGFSYNAVFTKIIEE